LRLNVSWWMAAVLSRWMCNEVDCAFNG
jgi:hypothetical protein